MRGIKIYLTIVTVLLIGAIGLGVYTWYVLQTMDTEQTSIERGSTDSSPTSVGTQVETSATSERLPDNAPVTIKTDTLTPTQKSMLEAFGIKGDIVITPAMIQCAEDAVGKTRLDEIIAGAAPSPLESLKLLPCFKK